MATQDIIDMMICSRCGRTGIRWMGPLTNLTHTKCPHCGGINCQEPEQDDDEFEYPDEAYEAYEGEEPADVGL